MPMKLMFMTNDLDMARLAQHAGVDRIFIDLEKIGKFERQGHLDTVISSHQVADISKIKPVLNRAELLVRINPIHDQSKEEIDEVISEGADIVMLPMFKTPREVATFIQHLDGRAKSCLLLETSEALVRLDDILAVDGIDEVHVGLNDLHLSMGLDFMFELLNGGIVDHIAKKVRKKGLVFGFGGIARVGMGSLPAEVILAEHIRMGSEMVILSRAFHDRAVNIDQLQSTLSFREEIEKIRDLEKEIHGWDRETFAKNRQIVKQVVRKLVYKEIEL